MRKNVFGRQFKRDANERKALFKNLLTSLVMEERIKTTPAKAKAIRGAADKLVTKAKKALPAGRQGGDAAWRNLAPDVNHNAVVKLINDIAPRNASRQGGYTRIIRLSKNRVADNAPQVLMEWVEKKIIVEGPKDTKGTEGPKVKKETKVKKEAKKESKEPKETKAKETKKVEKEEKAKK